MSARIVVDLPFPVKALWPNGGHGSRWAVSDARKKHKAWGHTAALAAKAQYGWLGLADGMLPLSVRLTIHAKPKGPTPDRDNCIAAAKAYLDGIALALGINDKHFASPLVEFALPRNGRFVFEIGG